MREYEQSHPWLTFWLDLGRAPADLWLLLGEAVSKCEHLAGVPLRPALHEHFNQLFLAKGVLATTAIEGNTLTEDEVLQHIRGTLKLPASKEYLAREVDNIIRIANEIWQDQLGRYKSLSPELIREFNRRILEDLTLEPHVVPGESRTYSVGVGTYRAAPAADCDYLLGRLCAWLNEEPPEQTPERRMAHAIVKAVLAHLYLAWIHPFGDGNGRTARLMEFQILVQAGVPMPAAHLLSNHYNSDPAPRTDPSERLPHWAPTQVRRQSRSSGQGARAGVGRQRREIRHSASSDACLVAPPAQTRCHSQTTRDEGFRAG